MRDGAACERGVRRGDRAGLPVRRVVAVAERQPNGERLGRSEQPGRFRRQQHFIAAASGPYSPASPDHSVNRRWTTSPLGVPGAWWV